jgi:hypothetical protein
MAMVPEDKEGLWLRVDVDDESLEVHALIHQRGTRTWASGLRVVRPDRQPLKARDLRQPLLREAIDTVESLRGFTDARDRITKPAAPGPAGHSRQHFETVWRLWLRALEESPGREIVWMCEQWDPPASNATMRRWRDRAREMFDKKGRR